jgi:hypothetical protein
MHYYYTGPKTSSNCFNFCVYNFLIKRSTAKTKRYRYPVTTPCHSRNAFFTKRKLFYHTSPNNPTVCLKYICQKSKTEVLGPKFLTCPHMSGDLNVTAHESSVKLIVSVGLQRIYIIIQYCRNRIKKAITGVRF